jgi:mitogen-activated protein kinase 1/3
MSQPKPVAPPAGRAVPKSSRGQDWKLPDRYEVVNLIGTGSYGHVCEAIDKVENRAVAIKKIHKVFEDLIDCKRILREIAILNRLKHPNVIAILDIIVPDDLERFDELYIVLEICDSDFKKLFNNPKDPVFLLDLHVKTLLYSLLAGVKYLHSAGIYHRDLKPANCLVNRDCTVKICDFGLSRAVGMDNQPHLQNLPNTPRQIDDTISPPITASPSVNTTQNKLRRQLTGHVVTRWYRAPELILLEENYTEAIDVWSIGCIFAELLGMMKENIPNPADRGPLFPGSSCFPLSPDHKHAMDYKFHTRGNRDQLNMIFNIIGTPEEEDTECLEKSDARRYIGCFTKRQGVGLGEKYKNSPQHGIDLLEKMLHFNPKKRLTVNEALNHPFLTEVRGTTPAATESVAVEDVFLPFELEPELDENYLRKYFINEILRFHPEVQMPEKLSRF